MCAFSYVWWSLLVTWQRQRLQLHHSIRCTWKPCKHHSSMFGIADRSFTLQEQELSTFLAPATLTLTQWPSYKNSTRSPWRYTACVNMNFIRQGFRKLSLDRHTYRPTYMTNIISDAAWRVVNNVGRLFTQQLHRNTFLVRGAVDGVSFAAAGAASLLCLDLSMLSNTDEPLPWPGVTLLESLATCRHHHHTNVITLHCPETD